METRVDAPRAHVADGPEHGCGRTGFDVSAARVATANARIPGDGDLALALGKQVAAPIAFAPLLFGGQSSRAGRNASVSQYTPPSPR